MAGRFDCGTQVFLLALPVNRLLSGQCGIRGAYEDVHGPVVPVVHPTGYVVALVCGRAISSVRPLFFS